jgi:hypothetical protein
MEIVREEYSVHCPPPMGSGCDERFVKELVSDSRKIASSLVLVTNNDRAQLGDLANGLRNGRHRHLAKPSVSRCRVAELRKNTWRHRY